MYSVSMSFGGQTSAYRFLSVMNPVESDRHLVLKKISVIGYAGALSLNTVPLIASRITTASGGSVQVASVINKFSTDYPDAAVEIRTANPTVTAGARIYTFAPPLQGVTAGALSPAPQNAAFSEAELKLHPGEGFALHQEAAGLGAQNYSVYVSWVEQPE